MRTLGVEQRQARRGDDSGNAVRAINEPDKEELGSSDLRRRHRRLLPLLRPPTDLRGSTEPFASLTSSGGSVLEQLAKAAHVMPTPGLRQNRRPNMNGMAIMAERKCKDHDPSFTVYDYPEGKRRYVVTSGFPENGRSLVELLLRLILSETGSTNISDK